MDSGGDDALGALRARHPGWLIGYRQYADGWRYDGRRGDDIALVRRDAEGLSEAIRGAERTWPPPSG